MKTIKMTGSPKEERMKQNIWMVVTK